MKQFIGLLFIAIAGAACGMVLPQNEGLPLHVAVASQYIDKSETKDRKELKAFLGVDPVKVEWCAAFANASLKRAGKEGTNSLMARSFLEYGTRVDTPQLGDIIVFPRGENELFGHVGFYITEKIIDKKLYYVILSGNQNNKVTLKLYKASNAIGMRRVNL